MNIAAFKKVYRLVDYQRRLCMLDVYNHRNRKNTTGQLTFKQLDHLMLLRMAMPCNLRKVMILTGLSNSAASLFIDKLTREGFIQRIQDPADRRRILISPAPEIAELLNAVDRKLDDFITQGIADFTPAQIAAIEETSKIVCSKLESIQSQTDGKMSGKAQNKGKIF